MSPRRGRIRKIAQHRERELERRATELAKAREAVTAACARMEAETSRMREAELGRSALAEAPVENDRWREANEWVELRSLYHRAAQARLQSAQTAEARAHAEVLSARAALRRLEVLDQRLGRVERRDEERKESKLQDETAATRAALSRPR